MRTRQNNRQVNGRSPSTIHHPSSTKRSAFTLIELLVVIGIIVILIGLTTAAALRIKAAAEVVKNRHNITQLDTSIQAFTSKAAPFIPSRIVLRNDGNYLATDPVEVASAAYLKKVWPNLKYPVWNGTTALGWCPDDPAASTPGGATLRYELEGDQCLVFFLGGMQVSGSCQGFSVNKSTPTLLNGKFDPPFMEFPSAKLVRVPTSAGSMTRTALTGTTLSACLSFIDPYDRPYAYFSSRSFGRRATGAGFVLTRDGPYASAPGYCRLDCDGLRQYGALNAGTGTTEPPAPLYEPGAIVKFYSRDGFQIISAGPDQVFGSNVDSANASQPYDSRSAAPFQASAGVFQPFVAGHDDLTNFHPSILGAPR